MNFSKARTTLLTIGTLVVLLFAGALRAFAQFPEPEAAERHLLAHLAELESDAGDGASFLSPRVVRATLPVAIGWFNGQPCLYISTDASDADVAKAFGANYAPSLAKNPMPSPILPGLSPLVPIYAVTNFPQGNIVPSAPIPAGAGNATKGYSPLWQVNTVTWKTGVTPQVLRSEQEVQAMQAAGKVTISKTQIIVNCSILWTPQGGALPGMTISMTSGSFDGSTQAKATLPVTVGWFNGQAVLYLSPEASDAAAGGPQANLSTLLGVSANTDAVVPIFVVTNFKQGNIIPSAPLLTGPKNANNDYSPLWQVQTVTWKSGITPSLLRSADDVRAAANDGRVTVAKTNIIVNCPVLFTPLGGLLPDVTVTISED